MSDKITELSLTQLRKALQQLALPAVRQLARLKGFDVPFEVADDFDNWCKWALQSSDVVLTNDQRFALVALDARLDEMSGEHGHEQLWTDEGFRSGSEWEGVRRDARQLLELFGWPLEDTDAPGGDQRSQSGKGDKSN